MSLRAWTLRRSTECSSPIRASQELDSSCRRRVPVKRTARSGAVIQASNLLQVLTARIHRAKRNFSQPCGSVCVCTHAYTYVHASLHAGECLSHTHTSYVCLFVYRFNVYHRFVHKRASIRQSEAAKGINERTQAHRGRHAVEETPSKICM